MSPRTSDIAHMQSWLFRMAERRWDMSPVSVAEVFRDYDVYGYISSLYELLHLNGYECALNDIEKYLKGKGWEPCLS